MIKPYFYFIPIHLREMLKKLVADFGGYVCIRAVEPAQTKPAELIKTGIIGQEGEIEITENCKGFLLEGSLEEFGYRDLAVNVGCVEFDTAEKYITFENNLLKDE